MDRELINEVVLEMRDALRLSDWYIGVKEDPEQLHGFVAFEREQRRATIHFNPETITAFHIRHEMIHVLLHDMSFIGNNGRSVDLMEVYNLYEERVCNALAEVLSG